MSCCLKNKAPGRWSRSERPCCRWRRSGASREIGGGLIEALKALADICLRLEDWPGAIAAAEELVALRAADAETWAGLGDARLNVGYATGAADAYRQAVALAPREPMLRRNYADSLIRAGRLDEAARQLDAAEKLEPAAPLLALHRAELAKATG